MEDIIKKYCHYIVTKDEEELNDIKEFVSNNNLNYKKIKKQAHNTFKKITKSMQELGYDSSFDSFCNCLSNYIDIKDKLNDEEKLKYLSILFPISEIYDISLKEELSKYISYKKNPENKDYILDKFCKYYINPDSSPEEFNELKSLSDSYDFNELESEALSIIENLKEEALRLGYNIDFNSFCNMLDFYGEDHSNLSDTKKEEYLRCLLKLSKIYEVNLRSELEKYLAYKKENISTNTLPYIIKNITNPLDNMELVKKLLLQRYEECSFDINSIILDNDKLPTSSNKEFDYTKIQSSLTAKLLTIYLDKINNFAEDDLNKNYLHILNEEDIKRLSTITEKDIYTFIMANKENIETTSIIKKLNLSENLFKFLNIATETTNFNNEHIGIANNSLFTTEDSNFTIRIYLNTPSSKETYEFLSLYIEKCILNNISYDCTGVSNDTILYATTKDISIKLDIINKIKTTNPDLTNGFGTPFHGGGLLNNSYYSISHSGITNKQNSCIFNYTEYFNSILEVAYYRTLSKIVINKLKTDREIEIISEFINLKDIEFLYDYNNPIKAKYGNIEFSKLKDLINPYIPTVSNTIRTYIEEQKDIVDEFKKSIIYINNICQNKDKKENSNIAINQYLENEAYKEENKKN